MNYDIELVIGNLCYLQNVYWDCLVKIVLMFVYQENLVDCVCKIVKVVVDCVIQLLVVMVIFNLV